MPKAIAFTLIELLVVIAVIALLIGILMPALGAAKAASESAVCLSNTRTIATVMEMYAQDDPRNFYPTARMPMTDMSQPSWLDLTWPYVQKLEVYRCPSDGSDNFDASMMPRLTSYGLNAYFTPNHPPYNGITPLNVREPSRTILAAELIEGLAADHFMPMYWGKPPAVMNMMMQNRQWDSASQLPLTIFHTRHPGARANYVFVDGHAGAHPFEETWAQEAGAAPSRNWYDPK